MIEVQAPSAAGGGEDGVLVRPAKGCICGSDMPYYKGVSRHYSHPYPPGMSLHECIGTVEDSCSPRFQAGDEVLVLPYDHKGLVELLAVPDERVFHLPQGCERDHLLIGQPLGTVLWACRKLGNLIGKTAVVCGQGPIGLLFDRVLSNMGARYVIGLDRVDYRLRMARQMGATHTVNVETEDAEAAVGEITGGKLADLSVEAVGHEDIQTNELVDLTASLGTILAFGVPDTSEYRLRYDDIFNKNINLIFSVNPELAHDFPLGLQMVAERRVDAGRLITHHVPLSEIESGFALSERKDRGVLKVVVDYDW